MFYKIIVKWVYILLDVSIRSLPIKLWLDVVVLNLISKT
jgi:hypothetical protein